MTALQLHSPLAHLPRLSVLCLPFAIQFLFLSFAIQFRFLCFAIQFRFLCFAIQFLLACRHISSVRPGANIRMETVDPQRQHLRNTDAPPSGPEKPPVGRAAGRGSHPPGSLPPLQVRNWSSRSAKWDRGSSTSFPLNSEAEGIVTSKIRELSQLESPLLRELSVRLGSLYNVDMPKPSAPSGLRARSPYADIDVGARWPEIQGAGRWAGLLDPIDPVVRAEAVRYGEFVQACYDAFDGDKASKYCGSCKYGRDELLDKVGLESRGYSITQFLYGTAELDLPKFFTRTVDDETWSKDSNWIGYVAVSTSPEEIARLGRRDILVAWRGTITTYEWIQDLQDYWAPTGFDGLRPVGDDVMVESGFLSVYKSSNAKSRYNKASAREQVLGAVKDLVEAYKHEGQLSITVTGHSLGSALATLCGYDLAESCINVLNSAVPSVSTEWNSGKSTWKASPAQGQSASNVEGALRNPATDAQNPAVWSPQGGAKESGFRSGRIPITVFSFAGPRVGNAAFKKRVEELGVAVLRVVNKHDLVTKVPGAIHGYLGQISSFLDQIVPLVKAYEHVGEQLEIDFLNSSFLEPKTDPANSHNMEAYLHVVDGFHGTGLPFEPTLRDYTLVNKGADFLRKEYFIPPSWWQEKNKGLIKDKSGHWIVPERGSDLFPTTPISEQTNDDEQQRREFWHVVAIAQRKSSKQLGMTQGLNMNQPAVLPGGTDAAAHES